MVFKSGSRLRAKEHNTHDRQTEREETESYEKYRLLEATCFCLHARCALRECEWKENEQSEESCSRGLNTCAPHLVHIVRSHVGRSVRNQCHKQTISNDATARCTGQVCECVSEDGRKGDATKNKIKVNASGFCASLHFLIRYFRVCCIHWKYSQTQMRSVVFSLWQLSFRPSVFLQPIAQCPVVSCCSDRSFRSQRVWRVWHVTIGSVAQCQRKTWR